MGSAGFQAHFGQGSLPELRNRERSTTRQSIAHPRSSTPPPLPKSVSLPLHAIQRPLTNGRYSCDRLSKMKPSPPRPCTVNNPSRHGTSSTQSRSSVTLLEHSPLLDEVLRQITNSREAVLDIRTQLEECQLVTTRSHAVLQREVETYRERKQQEDAAKLELKARTKFLDDSKRGAEGGKKDAEKNLKAIQLVRNNAGHQLESVRQKILALESHLLEDQNFIFYYQNQSLEHPLNDTLEQKKADIHAAEHSVAILNQRSRELEDRLSSERRRLRILRQKSEDQKSCYPFLEHMNPMSQHDRRSKPLSPSTTHDSSLNRLPFVTPDGGADLPTIHDSQLLHHPRNACPDAFVGNVEANKNIVLEVPQHAPFDGSQESSFSSVESEVVSTTFGSGLNHGFILSRGHSDDVSGSFGWDRDTGTEKNWGGYRSSSSIPTFIPTISDGDRSFETRFQSYDSPNYRSANFNAEHANWTESLDVNSPAPYDISGTNYYHATNIIDQSQPTRSLPSTTLTVSEFGLFENPCFEHSSDTGNASANSMFDALNPTGLGSALVTPSSSTSQSLLRAFAPSPAEREALQRALTGSTNASLERLPSLSAVGSLPPSPASSHIRGLPQHSHSLRDLGSFFPTWFKAFPRSSTVKFSPWEEEDSRNDDQSTVLQAQTTERDG